MIKIVAQMVQKIVQQEGDNTDQPAVIKSAFTGCAANNIEAYTLHSAFGFNFGNNYLSMSNQTRDLKRTSMKNLVMVIIDEISMITSDQLIKLDMRLQEIMEKVGTPFGGVSILVFGDLMQLKPVQGRYVFESPTNQEFRTAHALDPQWKHFQSILLEQNHRQGNERSFADTLNRIRTGTHNEKDISKLNSRVRPDKHEDIKTASIYIGCKRKDVARVNNKYLGQFPGNITLLKATHHHATMKDFKPRINKEDNTVHKTGLVNLLMLKIGVKIMIIRNIDVPDMLSNGQIGTLLDFIKTKDGKIDILVVKLNEPKAGKEHRKANQKLAAKYPEAVFIKRMKIPYTIGKKSGDIGSTATVIQFPVRLSYAMTAHKIQGQTIPAPTTVAMDIKTVWEPAQAYVMLSRVQSIEQLFIVGEFKPEKIYTKKAAEDELKRLENISINRNPKPWDAEKRKTLKIATLNCAGFVAHNEDIKLDRKLLKGHIIHLLETSLPSNFNEAGLQIDSMKSEFVSVGKGKGIASFITDDLSYKFTFESNPNLQIVKIRLKELDSISLYRSSSKSLIETSESILKMIDLSKATLITGDFNVCLMKRPSNIITTSLKELGFKQLIEDATHIQGTITIKNHESIVFF